MRVLRNKRILILLLSVLLAASTASLRSAHAEETPAPEETPDPSEAFAILADACCGANILKADSAAYAAVMLRWEEGYISTTSKTAHMTRNQRLNASFDAAARLMQTTLTMDWTSWSESLVEFQPDVYDSYAQNVQAFTALAQTIDNAIQLSSAECVQLISRDLREAEIPIITGGMQEMQLNWRDCAALYYVFGEDFINEISSSLAVQYDGNIYSGITLCWPNPTIEQIAALGTHDQTVEAVLALDYLNTVYNDDGTVAPVETHIYSKEYLSTVAHPVPGGVIKNGWYDPRSHETRLHVGTDIKMRGKTPILSVTDGVVKYIGYLPIPGYYVMIEDPFGYTYHYYHMYELTTFVQEGDAVKQGQQIGIVGSTGNSVAYHLHLGLVSPEGKYLNPYDLFVQAGIGPILEDD